MSDDPVHISEVLPKVIVSWENVDPAAPVPDPVPKCPVGMAGHRWHLSIEEGQPTLTLAPGEECPKWSPTGDGAQPVCEWHWSDYMENFEFLGVDVKLRWATDCPGRGAVEMGSHYVNHNPGGICDCNHWIELAVAE